MDHYYARIDHRADFYESVGGARGDDKRRKRLGRARAQSRRAVRNMARAVRGTRKNGYSGQTRETAPSHRA